jgi:hypothetical protein
MPTTFDPVASFVSAVNLHWDCPPSLLKALADTHPDREIWLESSFEEERGIQNLDKYKKIMLGECQALWEKGAPWAIPTMCVLTIKKDKNLCPLHAKSRIVVLGNHEDRVLKKSNKFAPVLCQDSLCFLTSMVNASCCPLCQGDCKNAFCQGILPPDKITIVFPPAVIPKPPLMNIGSLNGCSMDFGAAHGIGMTKLMPSLGQLGSPHSLRSCVSIQDLYVTPQILRLSSHWHRCPLVSTPTTLSISPKILQLKLSFVIFSPSIARWTLWVLLNGSLVFIFLGASPLLQLMSISTSLVLPQTLSRALPAKPTMRLQWPPRIDQEFQSIPLRHMLMLMTILHRSYGRTLIKVSSAASVGCHLLHALTLPLPTPSFPPTGISRCWVT